MRIPSLLLTFALLGSSAWAQEEGSHYYLQLGIGGVFSTEADDVPGGSIGFDPGFSTGIAIGREFELSERFSVDAEVEAFYQYWTVDENDLGNITSAVDDDAKTFAVMFNGILNWNFTPQYFIYGGAGVGYATEIEYAAWDSGSLSTQDSDGVAFQARLGCGYNLGGTYDVMVGYRFFKTEPIDVVDEIGGGTSEIDVSQHSLEATFRWKL